MLTILPSLRGPLQPARARRKAKAKAMANKAMEHCVEDCKELLSQIKEQDKMLRLKRRWLMDLPLSESEQKLMKKFNPLMDKTIPETLLREDDVYYDTIRSFVQRGFGAHHYVKEQQDQDNVQSLSSHYIFKNLSSVLDDMTNEGLYYFANMLTDGLVEFEETRWKMKKVIREYLPTFLNKENNSFQNRTKQLSRLLKDRQYFHLSHDVLHPPTKFLTAAARVLDGLEELPLQTLSAMHRKLKGESGYIPEFGSYKTQQKRDFIGPVKNRCISMLSKLHEREEPQEPLVKAMAVAGLTLKLILGRSSVPEFRKFSKEIESLQNNIVKAISLISSKNKVSFAEIKALHKKFFWAESKAEFSKKKLRIAIRNILIDLLFECGDMKIIPECLTDAVFNINKRFDDSTCGSALQEEIEKEVGILLCVSAQTKQIVWDLLPGQEVDQDFASAYMEDSEGSHDDEDEEGVNLARNFELRSDDSKGFAENFDETNPFDSGLPIFAGDGDGISSHRSPNSQLNCKLESVHIGESDTFDSGDFIHYSSYPESKRLSNTKSLNGNEHRFASIENFKQTNLHPFLSTTNQSESCSPLSPHRSKSGDYGMTQETVNDSARNEEFSHYSSPSRGTANLQYKQCTSRNKYLSIQRASDETSMAIYRIIGGMLEEFAQDQHLDLRHDDISYLRSHSSDS